MKRSDITLGGHYALSRKNDWENDFLDPTRVKVIDARAWNLPPERSSSGWHRRETFTHTLQSGDVITTTDSLIVLTENAQGVYGMNPRGVWVVNVHAATGEPIPGEQPTLVDLRSLRAPWDSAIAHREEIKARRAERTAARRARIRDEAQTRAQARDTLLAALGDRTDVLPRWATDGIGIHADGSIRGGKGEITVVQLRDIVEAVLAQALEGAQP